VLPEVPATLSAMLVLRWLGAIALVPHVADKVLRPQNALGFFAAAGLPRPRIVLVAAVVTECAVATSMISGVALRLGAVLGAVFLSIAAICVLKVSRGQWLWNAGGAEYPAHLAAIFVTIAVFG
jgi:uncharacterized membrane protein YphA (DoxX/SURF4 family)